jgi:hypothetical protein
MCYSFFDRPKKELKKDALSQEFPFGTVLKTSRYFVPESRSF